MASSTTKKFAKDTWFLAAEAVTRGNISKIEDTAVYRYTYVANGEDSPEDSKRGVAWTHKTLVIDSDTGLIDVYLKATNKDGEIEVML